ncbi:hypothetical protein Hanom_Chr04g00377131 [Helianthus anomalus]
MLWKRPLSHRVLKSCGPVCGQKIPNNVVEGTFSSFLISFMCIVHYMCVSMYAWLLRLVGMVRVISKGMGCHVGCHVTGSEDGPKRDGLRGWRMGPHTIYKNN